MVGPEPVIGLSEADPSGCLLTKLCCRRPCSRIEIYSHVVWFRFLFRCVALWASPEWVSIGHPSDLERLVHCFRALFSPTHYRSPSGLDAIFGLQNEWRGVWVHFRCPPILLRSCPPQAPTHRPNPPQPNLPGPVVTLPKTPMSLMTRRIESSACSGRSPPAMTSTTVSTHSGRTSGGGETVALALCGACCILRASFIYIYIS